MLYHWYQRGSERLEELVVDFLKVVRMVFWSGVVGPCTNDELSLARASRSYDRASGAL